MDPTQQAHRTFGLEQHLALETVQSSMNPDAVIVLRDPWLLRVADRHATAVYYVRPHDLVSGRLLDLHYGWREFKLSPDQVWDLVASKEVATGNDAGPAFLIESLARAVDATASSSSTRWGIGRILDEQAIRNVIAAYGLAADGGDADLVGDLYTVDTHVDVEGEMLFEGRQGMKNMIRSSGHRSLLPWAGHTMGPGLIAVEGDRAIATHFSRTYGPPSVDSSGSGLHDRRPFRFGVNRWELQRGIDRRWRIARRISRSAHHNQMPELLIAGMRDQMSMSSVGRAGRLADRQLVRASTARDVVTAASFAITARAVHVDPWPFAPGATDDNLGAGGGRDLYESLVDLDSSVGCLPTAGYVICGQRSAIVLNAVLDYVGDGSGGVRVSRISLCRWELEVQGDDSWLVSHLSIHRAGSTTAAAMLGGEVRSLDSETFEPFR